MQSQQRQLSCLSFQEKIESHLGKEFPNSALARVALKSSEQARLATEQAKAAIQCSDQAMAAKWSSEALSELHCAAHSIKRSMGNSGMITIGFHCFFRENYQVHGIPSGKVAKYLLLLEILDN